MNYLFALTSKGGKKTTAPKFEYWGPNAKAKATSSHRTLASSTDCTKEKKGVGRIVTVPPRVEYTFCEKYCNAKEICKYAKVQTSPKGDST